MHGLMDAATNWLVVVAGHFTAASFALHCIACSWGCRPTTIPPPASLNRARIYSVGYIKNQLCFALLWLYLAQIKAACMRVNQCKSLLAPLSWHANAIACMQKKKSATAPCIPYVT